MDEEILVSETELLLNGHDLMKWITECVNHLTSEDASPLKRNLFTALAKKGESPKRVFPLRTRV